ncbi:MAG: DUF1840 domain-containing protein [Proteobacteria bacterium]|uniref:DUF1840 domain-containing protein n=1 Tax=Aquabacterium sp. TaxID=1872578 RepID=UPI0035C7285E|nr:DUF1840 domain-containing protein [Pseudomonadota bacterium]
MTITFKSQATGDLVMLNKHAEALLRLLGKTAESPGILAVAEMPAALQKLRELPDPRDAVPPPAVDAPGGGAGESLDEAGGERPTLSFQDEPVSLRQRAAPLVRLIEQALAEGKPVVWGV